MENIELLVDLAIALSAALLGGFIANRLRQPVILGYLFAGILVGPFTPGPVTSVERVETLASLGVALLMFALGAEFSLEGLQRVRKVAVGGGTVQLLLVLAMGTGIGLLLGYRFGPALFLGGILSISSSILILKLLLASDSLDSPVGRVALAMSVVQDIATVAMIIILPSLAQGSGVEMLGSAATATLIGIAFLVGAYLLGTRLVPPLLERIARTGSRELFLLMIVAIAAGMAVLGQVAGISFALGAFVAGLVVSESEFSSHVLDEIIPVRDIFASLFFVSIGMLVDPLLVLDNVGAVLLLVATILVGKLVITTVVVRFFGYDLANSLRIGMLLAQIGEFSFVLAGVGLARHAIDDRLYGLVLASALATLILNPLIVNNSERLARLGNFLLRLVPGGLLSRISVSRKSEDTASVAERVAGLKRHVIVCGYGRVGKEVARALGRRGFPFIIIEYNSARVEEARHEGYLCLLGDASQPAVLERAGISGARMVVVTLPDFLGAETLVRAVHVANSKIFILARTHEARFIDRLKAAGADQIIQPEFEAGLEMVRQALRNFGVSSLETQAIVGTRRREHYTGTREPDLSEELT